MSARFERRSTRPLTAESYRVAAQRAAELASKIAQMADHLGQPVAGRIMTRAIRDLAMHAKRLDDRHRAITGEGGGARVRWISGGDRGGGVVAAVNTCASCKHLGPPIVERCEWDEGHVSTLAPRGEVPFELCNETGAKYRTCKLIALPTDGPVGAAFPIDGEGYFAALCVSEGFGCNQWEAKS